MVALTSPFTATPPGRQAQRCAARGFTLIELMVVVAVIAILAAIAIPSYYRYMLRANRAAAETVMLDMSSAQERYMIDSRQYTTSNALLGYGTLPNTVAPNYTIAVATSAGPPPSYTVTATPIGNQTRDTDCGTLKLGSDGSKTASGTSTTCWKK
ncbi:type IV pilin protein [Dyella sp. 2RAB6]|uniref:type IV pilin protein n=1 Tax=Dyella sp. 2RAB6 TaxID=3232992 RepID=UPI003F8F269C